MFFHEEVERVFLQGGQDPRGMSEADRALASRDQALQQVVDRQVAGGTGQHLFPPANGLADQLDHGRRLARTRRPVDDRHVLGGERETDRLLLRFIEGDIQGEAGFFRAKGGKSVTEQDITELGQAVATSGPCAFQRGTLTLTRYLVAGEHDPVGGRLFPALGQFGAGHAQRALVALADDATGAVVAEIVFCGDEDGRARDPAAASMAESPCDGV